MRIGNNGTYTQVQEVIERKASERSVAQRHDGFRSLLGQRSKAGPMSRRENHRLHRGSLAKTGLRAIKSGRSLWLASKAYGR